MVEFNDIINANNRIGDVSALRTVVCQNYMKMSLAPGWQFDLYNKIQTYSGIKREKYEPVFEKMRDYGIEKYVVDDMDMSIIAQILLFDSFIKIKSETKKAFRRLLDDRNDASHLSRFEDPSELYLKGIIYLYNLKAFVRAVDQYEKNICDKEKSAFRKRYIEKIDNLKDTLDEERIIYVQVRNEINSAIKNILNSKDQKNAYLTYRKKDFGFGKPELNFVFPIWFEMAATEAGIEGARIGEVYKNLFVEIDHRKVNQLLKEIIDLEEQDEIPNYDDILRTIQMSKTLYGSITDGMKNVLAYLEQKRNSEQWVFLYYYEVAKETQKAEDVLNN